MNEQHELNPHDRGAGNISEQLKELLHRREEVCLKLEALPQQLPGDYSGAIAALEEEFRSAPEVPPEYAEILDRRFAAALQAARAAAGEAEARRAQVAAKIAEAATLRTELERLEAGFDLGVLPSELEALEKRWAECRAVASAEVLEDAAFQERFAVLREKVEQEAAAEAEKSAAALRLAEELGTLTAGEDMNLLHDRKAAIEAEYAALGTVPRAAADRYQDAHRKAGAKLALHYETLDLARWESYTHKLDLCAELEKLQSVPDADLPKAAKTLQELREKWKALGAVPKVKADEINPRYLNATRLLQHRVDEYFAQLRQTQKAAALRKQELCDKAAALADSTEWNATTEAFKALQAEWKTIPGAGAAEKKLFTAFRASADHFFAARNAYFTERNQRFDALAARKRELIAAAEALQDGAPDAVRRARELRSEFQSTAPAGRAEPELQRQFNAALDRFFAGRREAFAEKENRSRALIAELETIAAAFGAESESRIRAIRSELRELGCRNTFDAEKKAFEKCERALAAFRSRALTDKLALLHAVGSAAAKLYDRIRNGEEVEDGAFEIEYLDRFPRLHNAVALMKSARSGDAKALEKLGRQVENARHEHERVIAELEKIVGISSSSQTASSPVDDAAALAAELAAAIAGNFGSGSVKAVSARPSDPKQLLTEYLAAGLLPEEEFAASIARFEAAYGKVR